MTKPNRLTTLARSTAALVLLLATPQMAFAVGGQSTATVSVPAAATVIVPIAISSQHTLDFGNIVAGATAGTVVLALAGTRTATGGTTLGAAGTTAVGVVRITGLSGAAYTFSIADGVLKLGGTTGPMDMAITTFTNNDTGVITGGSIDTNIGATLAVASPQTAGAYTGSIDVTVTYN